MKFMQRAANTPLPRSPDEPSPKRRKTDSVASPITFNVDALADRTAIQAAIAVEEAKREAALEKQAAEAGDTRWVLSFEDQKQLSTLPSMVLHVVPTGFAHLDASPSQAKYVEDLEDKPLVVGRRSFGKFNRVLEKQQNPSVESSSDSESEDDDDENSERDDEYDPMSEMIKAERKQVAERAKNERREKKRAGIADLEKLAKRRKKENPSINLNKLTSLSGTNQTRPVQPPAGMECYNCGGNHFRRDCPNAGKRGPDGGDNSRPRKTQKQR